MKFRLVAPLLVLSFGLFLPSSTSAATIYTFTNTNESDLGSGSWGTVTTSLVDGNDLDALLNEILVQVDLADGYVLHGTSFGFNVVDPDAGVTITSIVDSTFFSVGSTGINLDGFGNYEFTIEGPSTSTARTNNLNTLSFIVGRTAGFSDDDQLAASNDKDWLFAAQIASLDEGVKTGFVASKLGVDVPPDTPPDVPAPEPASMVMLGTGLVGLAVSLRKRFRR